MDAPQGATLLEAPTSTSDTTTSPKGATLVKGADSKSESANTESGKVTKVLDADTVEITGVDGFKFNVRLKGIDAPEVAHPSSGFWGGAKDLVFGTGKGQSYGETAKDYLNKRLSGKDVSFNYDELDEHGRYIAKVTHDGTDINKELIEKGQAHHYQRYDKDPEYAAAYDKAQKEKAGMWGKDKDAQESPESFRRYKDDPSGAGRIAKHPVSAMLADPVNTADLLIGNLPSMAGQITMQTAGAIAKPLASFFGKTPQQIDKDVTETNKAIHGAIGDPFKKIATEFGGLDKSTIESSAVAKGSELLGEGVDWSNKKIVQVSGGRISENDANLLTTAFQVALLHSVGKVAAKTGLPEAIDKFTDLTKEQQVQYEANKLKTDREFEKFQKIKAEREAANQEAKSKVNTRDTETNQVSEKQSEFKFESGVNATKADHIVVTDSKGVSRVVDKATGEIIEPKVDIPKEVKIGEKKVPVVEGPIYEAGKDNLKLQPNGEPVAATHRRYPDGRSEILINMDQLHKDFERKAWTKPQYEGVEPLPEDAFNTPHEYAQFVLDHEKAHGDYSYNKFKEMSAPGADTSKAAYEQFTNEVALGKQLTFDFEDTVRKQALADFEAKVSEKKPVSEDPSKALDRAKDDLADAKWSKPEGKQAISEEALGAYLKKHKKDIEAARQRYFEEAGLDPVYGDRPDFKSWDEMLKDDIGVHLSNLENARADFMQVAKGLRQLAPRKGELEKVWEAIQRKTVDQLPDNLKAAAVLYDTQMRVWGQKFLDAGIIKGMLNDYATRMIDMTGKDPTVMDKFFASLEQKMAAGLPTKGKYGKSRLIDDFATLEQVMEEHGLRFKTKNLAEITEAYGETMFKAMLNKDLISKLEKHTTLDGNPVFMKRDATGRIPFGFVEMKGGMYEGYWVHPDVATPLKFVIDQREMGMIMRGLSATSNVIKRINVGLSLFHATTLTVGRWIGSGFKVGDTYNPVKQFENLRKAYDEAYSSGRLEAWQNSKLHLGGEADAGLGIVGHLAESADSFLKRTTGFEGDYLAKTVKLVGKPQEFLDRFTWDIVHDGSKLLDADQKLEQAKINHPRVPEKFLRDEIAKHINDVYGGINWFDAARDTNKFLEKLKMNLFSPEGRKYLQILEFAPDWTLSTLRVFARAIPNPLKMAQWDISKGLAGITKPLTAVDYARQYQMRMAVGLFTVLNALNISLSGKPIWENKDIFSIESGDGRAWHPLKHPSESYHWIGDFAKTFKNKLGFWPRMAYETRDQGFVEGAKTVAKGAMPFTAGSGSKGITEGIAGFAGVPVTGTSTGDFAGPGVLKNWERAFENQKKKLAKKFGIRIVDESTGPKGATLLEDE